MSWLDGSGGGSAARLAGLETTTGVAGEALEVHVALANPLAVELEVSRLRLRFRAGAGEAGAGAGAEGDDLAAVARVGRGRRRFGVVVILGCWM